MNIRATFAALILSATAAFGNTVTLDFGQGFTQQSNNNGLGGFWDSGYNLSATTAEFGVFHDPNVIAKLDRINTNETGFTQNVNSLTITRANGKPFDLNSLNIPSFLSNMITEWVGTDRSGTRVVDFATLIWDIVSIQGTQVNGTTVSQRLQPTNSTTVRTSSPTSGTATFGNSDPVFQLSGFTNLTSLTLSAGGSPNPCSAINLSSVDPRFAQSGYCSGVLNPNSQLTGIFTSTNFGSRNDLGYYDLASINISPVPLPAGMLLCLTSAPTGQI